MTLQEWIDAFGRGAVTELHHRCRVSTKTISEAARDGAKSPRIAGLISDATEGAVTKASLLGVDQPTSGGAA